MSNKHKVGGSVDAWCTRCKLMLAHTIEAMLGAEIKRVMCNTCQGKHLYKAQAPGVRSPKSPRAALGTSRANSYAALLETHHHTKAVPYSFSNRYSQGSVLDHVTFGIGIVTADKGENKIEVLFSHGPKVLIHAQA